MRTRPFVLLAALSLTVLAGCPFSCGSVSDWCNETGKCDCSSGPCCVPQNQPCQTAEDCCAGMQCLGTCQPRTSGGGGFGGGSGGGGGGASCSSESVSCALDNECCSGSCTSSSCDCSTVGQRCNSSSDCCTTTCIGGYCSF